MKKFSEIRDYYKKLYLEKFGKELTDEEAEQKMFELYDRYQANLQETFANNKKVRGGIELLLKAQIDKALEDNNRELFHRLNKQYKRLKETE